MTDTGKSNVLTQNKMSVMMDKPITSNGKTGLETCLELLFENLIDSHSRSSFL